MNGWMHSDVGVDVTEPVNCFIIMNMALAEPDWYGELGSVRDGEFAILSIVFVFLLWPTWDGKVPSCHNENAIKEEKCFVHWHMISDFASVLIAYGLLIQTKSVFLCCQPNNKYWATRLFSQEV